MAKFACIALLALVAFQAAVADRDPAKVAQTCVRNAEANILAKLAKIHAKTADHLATLGEYLVAQAVWVTDDVFDAAFFGTNDLAEVAVEAQAAADDNTQYYSQLLEETAQKYIPAVEEIVNATQANLIQLGDKAAKALEILTSVNDKHAEAAKKTIEIYTAAIKKANELTTASINGTASSAGNDVDEEVEVIRDVFLFAKRTILRNTEDVDNEILSTLDALP